VLYAKYNVNGIYLEHSNKVFDDKPVIVVEFILSHFQSLVGSDLVDGLPVCEHEPHHIICGVPTGYHIARDEPDFEAEFSTSATPGRKGNCRRMDNSKGQLPYLKYMNS
jgi:hypothetical protein